MAISNQTCSPEQEKHRREEPPQVEGTKKGIAEDVGGAIQGEIIDLYMESEAECWEFGRRQVEVRIIKEG